MAEKEVKQEEVKQEETDKEDLASKLEEDLKSTSKENKKEKKDKFKKELDSKDEKIAELKEALESYKDKYYRAIADLDNQRKQYDKEYRSLLKYSSQNLAEKLLPSFEMFSMVVSYTDNLPAEVSAYVQGFDMVYRQMVSALESEGVKEIACKVGDEFDHHLHSAMETIIVEDEAQVNKITKIISKGYMIHDRLLKPVSVIVGKKKEEVKEETKEDNNQAEA